MLADALGIYLASWFIVTFVSTPPWSPSNQTTHQAHQLTTHQPFVPCRPTDLLRRLPPILHRPLLPLLLPRHNLPPPLRLRIHRFFQRA